MNDDFALVRTLLAQAGLPASDPEVAGLAEAQPALRAAISLLHNAIGDDVDPVLVFDTAAGPTDWRDQP